MLEAILDFFFNVFLSVGGIIILAAMILLPFWIIYVVYDQFIRSDKNIANQPDDTDELQRNISRLGKQIDELSDDFNKLADNIKQQPSKPKDK